MKSLRLFLIALLAITSTALAQPPDQPAQSNQPPQRRQQRRQRQSLNNVEVIRNVEYGKGGDKMILLDIARPKETPKELMPAVIWIHGGGWMSGDKRNGPNVLLAAKGYFTVSINYRLSGEAPFPAAIEDCKCAVRWLRENAEKYHVDPDRIGVWGGSAGGHLALLVGTADEKAGLEGKGGHEKFSSRVQAVCSWFGPSDFTLRPQWAATAANGAVPRFLGGSYADKKDTYKLANPIAHVTADDPPVLMMHGDKDFLVPLEQSEVMLAALKKANVPAELVVVKNGGHGFGQIGSTPISPTREEIAAKVTEFFDMYLKKKTETQK